MTSEGRRTPDGYQHAEAFCVMKYATKKNGPGPDPIVEFLWNSRDGVTPFGIYTMDGERDMLHTEFSRDRRDPYWPHRGLKVGDRIFIDATPETVRCWVELRLKGLSTGDEDCPWTDDAGREEYISKIVADELEMCPPDIVTVTDEILKRLQRTTPRPPAVIFGSGRFA